VIRVALRIALLATIAVVTACASAAAPAATAVPPTESSAPPSTLAPTPTPTQSPATTPSPAITASTPPSVVQSGNVTVEIGDNFYLPEQVIVTTGTTVLWVNRGQMTHTASARDESFESGNLEFGQTYQKVFVVLGRYTYYCVQHEDMIGIVEVR
jgi:plastocyanin